MDGKLSHTMMTNGMSENIKRDCIMAKIPLHLLIVASTTLVCGVYGDGITNISQCMNARTCTTTLAMRRISFQRAFLAGRVDRISVRYADLVGSRMDGRNAFIGFQILGRWKASRTARGTTEWSMTAWRCRS